MKQEKTYKPTDEDMQSGRVEETEAVYLINTARKGISYHTFTKMTSQSPFTLDEWSMFLHLSERTMQRYKKDKKTFDPIYAEKILEITLLYQRGAELFGSGEKFNTWLDHKSIALGGVRPKDLLDSSFGIDMIKDELTRIEHGVLA